MIQVIRNQSDVANDKDFLWDDLVKTLKYLIPKTITEKMTLFLRAIAP
jgi:hypothetical protein